MNEDRIIIKDLLLRGIIGINAWEREKRQDILINITLSCDLRAPGERDKIEDAINYRTLTKKIIEHVEGSARYTVEALAADIATLCLGA
ncbi:MAG: dihydroneopterin aldolase, partial [Anaerolineales bacterium]